MNMLEQEYHNLSLWYFVSFVFGIIFFFHADYNYSLYKISAVLCALIIISRFFYKKNLLYFFIAFCFLSFVAGIFVANVRISNIDIKPIKKLMISEISGKIEQIKPTLQGTQVTLSDVSLENDQYLNKVRINIASKLLTDVTYGDIVKFKARLFPLKHGVLPGAYDFGFYMYMSGIEASGYALTKLEVIGSNQGFISQNIQALRRNIYERLISVLSSNSGNFAAAILIGETKAIPQNIAKNMRDSGVAHILSVSGLHLSLVAMIFFITSRMFLNFSNYLAYNYNIKIISACISIVGSFAYLLISGSNIAATRAFIMTFIFIIAIIMGRSPYPLRSVMIAAFLILTIYPEYIFHPSFQLSFSAVLCLISGYELYLKKKHLFGRSKGVVASIKFYIFANIYSSFLASIATTPFVIYHFYKFATYSVFMNLIAVPLMSFFMMPLALIALLLMPFALDGWVLKILGWFINIVTESAFYIVDLPGSVWVTGNISSASLLIFSFGFFWICIWKSNLRFTGFGIIAISLIMMAVDDKPDFIYDHNLKAVGVRNADHKLDLYSERKIPIFVSDYWASWYGQESIETKEQQIAANDSIFTLPSGKTVSLNYWECSRADVQIMRPLNWLCILCPIRESRDWIFHPTLNFKILNNDEKII